MMVQTLTSPDRLADRARNLHWRSRLNAQDDHGRGNEHASSSLSRLERVTGIEPALSAWEDYGTTHVMPADLHIRPPVSDRD